MSTLDDIRAREDQFVLKTYQRQPIVFVRGEGARLYDADGREYLDLLSGIGVVSLGHAHPGLARLIAEQAATLLHTSNLYYHPFQAEAAARLTALSGLGRAFFCNSGAEANEACLKFARRYWYTRGVKDRTRFVALTGGFAGRTFGALSVTHNPHYREPFAPLVEPVTFVDHASPDALAAAVDEHTAAVIAEPIQGEGGVRPLSSAMAEAIRDACASTGTLLIADEVQTGLGRTGHAFYSHALGWKPDLISVGKALGSGIPIGAALLSEPVAQTIAAGDHGTTYGGNLLACRAAAYVLEQLTDGGVIEHVKIVGAQMERRLRAMALKYPVIAETRGAGVMRALELHVDALPVVERARDAGLIVNRTAEKVIRMLPPLTIEANDIDRAMDILDSVLATVGAEVPA